MLESIILGLIQGITEFLPISSSGHLILARELFSLPLDNSLAFDVYLHLATVFAIITCFWGDIARLFRDIITEGASTRSSKLIYAIILATIPAALFGYYMDESIFRSAESVAVALIVGSVLFFIADKANIWLPKMATGGNVGPLRGLIIGFFQSLALIPGMSRAGSAISGGLLTGVSREESIRFAFLIGIPIILGAALKTTIDIGNPNILFNSSLSLNAILGFLAAFVSGLFSARFLVRYLSKNSFTPFIIYRLLLAVVILSIL